MKCGRCHKPIKGQDVSKARLLYENGKLKAALHYKCWAINQREAMLDGAGRESAPTAYEAKAGYRNADDATAEAQARREAAEKRLVELRMAEAKGMDFVDADVSLGDLINQTEQQVILYSRQQEIAEEEAKEPRPEAFTDWRSPTTFDI